MQKSLLKFTFLFTLIGLLASCAQQKSVATPAEDSFYKYKKVYVGNRIVYRENHEKISAKSITPTTKEEANTENFGAIRTTPAAPELKKSTTTRSEGHKAHKGFRLPFFGGLFSKKSDDREFKTENTEGTNSVRGILGIIGFILGLIGILGVVPSLGGIGFSAAILGIIFSAIGLKSEQSNLAYIGLVLCIIVAVLILIV